METALRLGKVPAALLGPLLARSSTDPSLLVGPALGEDAAAVQLGPGRLLLAAADPITFPTPRPGWYAVHVNANDVATRGGEPRWFLATLLLPSGASVATVERLLEDVAAGCAEVGAALVGGHTEVTEQVRLPLVAGCMLGTVAPSRLRRTADARDGDRLVLAGRVGIEGASILAAVAAGTLRAEGLASERLAAAAALVERHGISVLPAARLAAPLAHAMHDLTEGGLATAVQELASASKLGAVLERDRLSIPEEASAVCRALGLDVLGLLSSGCLLIAVSPARGRRLLARFAAAGIPAVDCGQLSAAVAGVWIDGGGERSPLPEFPRDELARWLEAHPR